MRSREFLFEANLQGTSSASWLGYLKNMLTAPDIAIGNNGEKDSGLRLTSDSRQAIKNLIDSIEVRGEDPQSIKSAIENTSLSFNDGEKSYLIKQIFKSPEIKSGSGGDASTEKKYWNDGEVAETFLGAALFARFQSTKLINVNDVISVLKSATPILGGFEAAGNRGNNPVTLRAINKPQNNDVVDQYINSNADLAKKFPKAVAGLTTALNACVAYVNESKKVADAINEIEANPAKESIEVKTDGVSDQKGTKADLTLKIGNKIRLLSLKVNAVKQFGQDTGATPEVITTFFQRFIPDVIPDPKNTLVSTWPDMSRTGTLAAKKAGGDLQQIAKNVYNLIGQVYQNVDVQLQAKLTDPKIAASLVTDLYNGIIHHAQGATAGQTLVILNPGGKAAWKELEFGLPLLEALQSFRLEASVGVAGVKGERNHILRIFGRAIDAKASTAMTTKIDNPADAAKAAKDITKKRVPVDPEMLIQLRSYVQEAGPTIRNIVEMGPLLKSITEVQEINATPDTAPTAAPAELDRIKNLAGVPATPPAPGPNTTTMQGTAMKSSTPPGIANQQRTLANKIPMGAAPTPTMPQ
jgi:hypothetical protein